MRKRKYLPSFSDLVDRLTISLQKSIFLHEHRAAYREEIADILHDMQVLMDEESIAIGPSEIHAIVVLMLANRFIWENEGKVRAKGADPEAYEEIGRALAATHSINGVRNTAKNVLTGKVGGRKDHKIDCFAAELVQEFGNWNVFD